jgi:hypothetical protein
VASDDLKQSWEKVTSQGKVKDSCQYWHPKWALFPNPRDCGNRCSRRVPEDKGLEERHKCPREVHEVIVIMGTGSEMQNCQAYEINHDRDDKTKKAAARKTNFRAICNWTGRCGHMRTAKRKPADPRIEKFNAPGEQFNANQ